MNRSQQQPRIKLQFLVLGAANAGKTSILRRHFHKTFREATRVPTLGSDFYVGRMKNPLAKSDEGGVNGDNSDQLHINLQMWDTPGRERFYFNRKIRKTDAASMEASFFRQADAFLLVYDMMSSTSFTQLLKWYADLMEICKNNPRPILIVANKLDLFLADQQREERIVHPRRVPQRDVMGLRGNFRGSDFRYEYSVSRKTDESSIQQRKKDHINPQRRMEISSFLANHENWTTDGSYLESLINSEDGSLPDREMVLLWCMRNGLKHIEVSAATGERVEESINEVIRLALEDRQERGSSAFRRSSENPRSNDSHDLRKRFSQADNRCGFIRPFPQLLRMHEKNAFE